VKNAVGEDMTEADASSSILPRADSPSEKLAMELIDLAVVDIDMITPPKEKTEEERACEITNGMLANTLVGEAVSLTYSCSSSSESDAKNYSGINLPVEMKGSGVLKLSADDRKDNIWGVTV
jgi:hypothetical protein